MPPHPAEAPTLPPHPAEAPTMSPHPAEPTPTEPGVPATQVPPDQPTGAAWPYGQPEPDPGPGWPAQAPPARRRRGLAAAVLIAVALSVVAGLGFAGYAVVSRILPSGTPSAGDPTPSIDVLAVPAVGTCYLTPVVSAFNAVAEQAERVACEEEHTLETIASGQVDPAANPEQPGIASPVVRDLYAGCETAAETFLGAPWRTMYTRLVLSLPSTGAWRQGATWYRCDLASSDGIAQETFPATGTLKGTAEPITCLSFTYQGTQLGDIEPSDCTAPHHGEFAGLVRLPDTDLAGNALFTDLTNRCLPVVLAFLGSSRVANELTYWFIYDDTVDALDRNVLCVVAIDQDRGTVVGSLRGIGAGPIPFG